MAINFPDSPTIGDEFTGGGFTWTWNGSSWEKVTASSGSGLDSLNNFVCTFNETSNNTFTLDRDYPAGNYSISLAQADASRDIYLVDSSGALVGYSTTSEITSSGLFNKVVILGTPNTQVVTFTYIGENTVSDQAGVTPNAAAYITSITPSDMPLFDSSSVIVGGNFGNLTTVNFIDSSGNSQPAKSVTVTNTNQLIVVRPDSFLEDDAPYDVEVINTGVSISSGVNILTDAVTAGGDPQWITGAVLPNGVAGVQASNVVEAADPDGASITYAAVSLPAGYSFDPATRTITGTPTAVGNDFIIISATDPEGNVTNRTFIVPVPSSIIAYYGDFDSADDQAVRSLAIDGAGNIYAGGYDGSGDGFLLKINRNAQLTYQISPGHQVDGVILDSSEDQLPIVCHRYPLNVKYYNSDNTFSSSIGFSFTGWSTDLAQDSTGQVVVSGSVGNGPDYWGMLATVSADKSTRNLIQWEPGYGQFEAVVVDSNDDYVAAGGSSRFVNSQTASYVAKFDSSLNLIWQKSFDIGGDATRLYGVAVDSNDNIYVSGNYQENNPTYGFLAKLDSSGNLLWQKAYMGDDDTRLYEMKFKDDNLYITGWVIGQGGGGIVIKTDLDGNLLWQRRVSNGNNWQIRTEALDINEANEIAFAGFVDEASTGAVADRAIIFKVLETTGTGSWNVGGSNWYYDTTNLTVTTGSMTFANGNGTVTSRGAWSSSLGNAGSTTAKADNYYSTVI